MVLYTDGRIIGEQGSFPQGTVIYPVLYDGRLYYYQNGSQWYVFSSGTWIVTGTGPTGGNVQNVTNMPNQQGSCPGACIPGPQPVINLGNQVQSTPNCTPPPHAPY